MHLPNENTTPLKARGKSFLFCLCFLFLLYAYEMMDVN